MADSYDALKATYESIILNPQYHTPLVLVKALRNGAVYGTKIRFPHALVMTLLFRNGTLSEKAQAIFKATRQHATNLARFAFLYKAAMLGLRLANGGKPADAHAFLAGLLGGYVVFGDGKSSVTQQIVIYVASRVVLGLAKLAVQPPGDNALVAGSGYAARGGFGPALGLTPARSEWLRNNSWPVFASLSWAGVMWMFEMHPDMLQPSLKSSMVYLYTNAEKWDSARNFLWHNK